MISVPFAPTAGKGEVRIIRLVTTVRPIHCGPPGPEVGVVPGFFDDLAPSKLELAPEEGLEPPTSGFGDQYSTN